MKRNPRNILHSIIASIAIIGSLFVIIIPNVSLQWGVVVLFILVIILALPSKKFLKSCPSCGAFSRQIYKKLPVEVELSSEVIEDRGETKTIQGWRGTSVTVIKCGHCSRERVETLSEFISRKEAPNLQNAEFILKNKLNN